MYDGRGDALLEHKGFPGAPRNSPAGTGELGVPPVVTASPVDSPVVDLAASPDNDVSEPRSIADLPRSRGLALLGNLPQTWRVARAHLVVVECAERARNFQLELDGGGGPVRERFAFTMIPEGLRVRRERASQAPIPLAPAERETEAGTAL